MLSQVVRCCDLCIFELVLERPPHRDRQSKLSPPTKTLCASCSEIIAIFPAWSEIPMGSLRMQ